MTEPGPVAAEAVAEAGAEAGALPEIVLQTARIGQVQLAEGCRCLLRAAGADAALYLDGVFANRGLALSGSFRPPFVGTRWQLRQAPDAAGAWLLACQDNPGFCLADDAGRARLERAAADGPAMRPLHWLLYRFAGRLLLRSRDGRWLGCRDDAPVCEPADRLEDTAYHWQPEVWR